MIPVTQNKFGKEGNCMAACLASIFECSPQGFPDFAKIYNEGGDWWATMRGLCLKYGFDLVYYSGHIDFDNLPEHLKGMYPYYLQNGQSPRGLGHACVGWMGKVIHDPHPSRDGILETEDYYFLLPIRPQYVMPGPKT